MSVLLGTGGGTSCGSERCEGRSDARAHPPPVSSLSLRKQGEDGGSSHGSGRERELQGAEKEREGVRDVDA